LNAFEKAIQLKPDCANYYLEKADTAYLLQRHKQALHNYEQAIKLEGKNERAYIGKGNALQNLGRFEEA